MHKLTCTTSLILLAAAIASGQTIVQSRGVDARVDYASLAVYGPWDDRNYQLTQDDLELLGEGERELSVRAPLFYRVELRKRFGDLPTSGPVQYPRSTLPRFLTEHGGFLVDGVLYRKARLENGRFVVDTSEPWMTEEAYRDAGGKALVGDVRVTSPVGAAESAVAINPVNPSLVVAGSNGPGSGQEMHYSTDGGESWSAAAALPLGGTCCDPTVGWSSDGSKAYAATLGSSAVYVYRSGDGGQTWSDLANEPGADPRREIGGGTDKEYLHVDTHSAACLDTIYLTWHESNILKFSRSTDRAHTWSTPVSLSSGSSERGIGSDVTTDAAGRIYYFWPAFNSRRILVRTSDDCGQSFDPTVEVATTQASFDFPIPSIDNRYAFVYVSADTDRSGGPFAGSVYAAWTDSTAPTGSTPSANHARIQVAYSRDGGATWATSTPHETADATTVDRWHQWLAVGADGTVHVVFYDTRNDPSRTSVDLFWSHSSDGAVTWSTPTRLTSQISPHMEDFFQFGDYNGLDVVLSDLVAVFTDNRHETGGATDSPDIYAAGQTVPGGAGIFGDGFESGSTGAWSSVVP
ncbi:MAG TPA: sialidase family protein [Candidatus Sulfomarinibacteraceae bacterium]|nr:sialidase family protein [Candidatus Sulfomarinibacteraceae bacterium]